MHFQELHRILSVENTDLNRYGYVLREVTSLANIKSAIKRANKAKVRALRNRAAKSTIKTAIKRFEEAVANNNVEDAKLQLQKLLKLLTKQLPKVFLA